MFRKLFGNDSKFKMPNHDGRIANLEGILTVIRNAKKTKILAAPHEVEFYPPFIFLDAAIGALKESQCTEIAQLPVRKQRELSFILLAVYPSNADFRLKYDWATAQDWEVYDRTFQAARDMEQRRKDRYSGKSSDLPDFGSVPDGQLRAWLQSAKKDRHLRHAIVLNAFRDTDRDAYEWIVQQRECDTATALTTFHLFNSIESLEFADEEMASRHKKGTEFRIAKTVCDRFNSGDYKTFDLSFVRMGYEVDQSVYVREVEKARQRFGKPAFAPAPAFFDYS